MASDTSDDEEAVITIAPMPNKAQAARVDSRILDDSDHDSEEVTDDDTEDDEDGEGPRLKTRVIVKPPTVSDPLKYQGIPVSTTVEEILEQLEDFAGERWYRVLYEDGREEEVSREAFSFSPVFRMEFGRSPSSLLICHPAGNCVFIGSENGSFVMPTD